MEVVVIIFKRVVVVSSDYHLIKAITDPIQWQIFKAESALEIKKQKNIELRLRAKWN